MCPRAKFHEAFVLIVGPVGHIQFTHELEDNGWYPKENAGIVEEKIGSDHTVLHHHQVGRVVEHYVGSEDLIRLDPNDLDVVVIGRRPHQVLVFPG